MGYWRIATGRPHTGWARDWLQGQRLRPSWYYPSVLAGPSGQRSNPWPRLCYIPQDNRSLTVSAAASFLRQKIGKQIARLAPREMAHIVWDGKRYNGKTRQPVCGRYLPPNSTDPGW